MNDSNQIYRQTTQFITLSVFGSTSLKGWQIAENGELLAAVGWVLAGILISILISIGGHLLEWLSDWSPKS